MNTYTLDEFINNIEHRKNMKRNDTVVVPFNEFVFKYKKNNKEVFEYNYNDNTYLVFVTELQNMFYISVIINNIYFEIGQIIDKTTEPQTYIFNLDCDVYFY